MDKKQWKRKIKKACNDAGTYQKPFDSIIDTLSQVMENRDLAQKQFEEYGSKPVIYHTNKGGNTNLVKNPALVMVNELNSTALAYWRDLGLTPAGFKKLGESLTIKKEASLEDIINKLGA